MIKRYDFYDRNDDAARAHVESNGDYVTYADYAKLQARADAMEAALRQMTNAVCGEDGFANAVRMHSRLSYPWPALDIAEEAARDALAQHGKVK